MSLLEQTAPGLPGKLRSLPPPQRRRVLVKACMELGRSLPDLDPSIEALIQSGLESLNLSSQQVAQFGDYAEAADERYFELREQGADEAIWKNWFAKARLATALAGIFAGDELEAAENAAYELCFVEDNNARAIGLIESAIKTESGK